MRKTDKSKATKPRARKPATKRRPKRAQKDGWRQIPGDTPLEDVVAEMTAAAARRKPTQRQSAMPAPEDGGKQAESASPVDESKRGRGRPTIYTEDLGFEICQRIAVREPLFKICEDEHMPSEVTVYQWRAKYPEFAQNYARAREARAESRSDRIDHYVEMVKVGTLDPNAARVMIDAEKWQAGKEQPKKFGEKVEVDTPKDGGLAGAAAVTMAALAQLAERGGK